MDEKNPKENERVEIKQPVVEEQQILKRNFAGFNNVAKPLSGNVDWNKKAQNILLKYNKNKTLTSELFIELVNLITQFRSDVNSWSNSGNGNGNDNGNNNGNIPPPFEELTPEQIRDKLMELTQNERLDASHIKNISENVFVRFNGQNVRLQVFLEYLWSLLNEIEETTREKIIELLGFEPFDSQKVVQDLSNPREDTVISTSGLAELLENMGNSNMKIFEFSNLAEIRCNHEFQNILTPTVYVNNRLVFTYIDTYSTTGVCIIKFKEPKSGKIIINGINE